MFYVIYIYNWWLMDVIMLIITQTRIVTGRMILQALVDFTKHRESCTLAPLKNLMKLLLISTLEKMLVDHRWNCWFNTGKTMFSQQRTKCLHDFIVDFSMIFLCFSDEFSHSAWDFRAKTPRLFGSPAGRSPAWASAKTPASSRHWDFVQPAPGYQCRDQKPKNKGKERKV